MNAILEIPHYYCGIRGNIAYIFRAMSYGMIIA